MKNKIILISGAAVFILVSGLMAAKPGEGRDGGVCRQDREKFCSEVKPGKGNVIKCLAEHKKELSKDCQARVERGDLKKLEKFAGKNKKGKAGFAQYRKGFRDGFMAAWKSRSGPEGRRGKKLASAGVCKEDSVKLCKDVKPGEGRVKACLLENKGKLSDGCKARMEKSSKN